MKFSFRIFKKGFTLLEIMIAISVMTIGIMGIYALVPKIISIGGANNNRFIASQLAREGLEIVRNIRDTNWLEGNSFDQGLNNGDWRVQYNRDYLLSFSDEPLKIDAQGFYNYNSDQLTKFKRKVTISHPESNNLDVKIQITWSGKGSPFIIKEKIYDWK